MKEFKKYIRNQIGIFISDEDLDYIVNTLIKRYGKENILNGKCREQVRFQINDYKNSTKLDNITSRLSNYLDGIALTKAQREDLAIKMADSLEDRLQSDEFYFYLMREDEQTDECIQDVLASNDYFGYNPGLFEDNYEEKPRFEMRDKSIIKDDIKEVFRYIPKKRKVPRGVIALMIIAVLVGAVSVYSNVKKGKYADLGISPTGIVDVVVGDDDFHYSNIHTTTAEAYIPTCLNTIDVYNLYKDLNNEEFKYLGFYRAYEHIIDNRLFIMDNLIKKVKTRSSCNDELKIELEQYDVYLEFMYARLVSMGCEEIQKDKYREVIKTYKQDKLTNPDEETFYNLSDSDKKLVAEIRDMYTSYSEKLERSLKSYDFVTSLGRGM